MEVGEERKISEDRKIVLIAIDGDSSDRLYEHIGTGKGGIEWHTGTFVIEKEHIK